MDHVSFSLVSRQDRASIRRRVVDLEMHADQHVRRRLDRLVVDTQRVLRNLRVGSNGRLVGRARLGWTHVQAHHDLAARRLSVRSGDGSVDVLGERQRVDEHTPPVSGRAGHQTLPGRVRRADDQRDLAVRVGSCQELFASLGCFVSQSGQTRHAQVSAPPQASVSQSHRLVSRAQRQSQSAHTQNEQRARLEFALRGAW